MTDEELQEIEEQRAYWQTIANLLHVNLAGFTGRSSASFLRNDGSMFSVGDYGHISVREIFLLALTNLTKIPRNEQTKNSKTN